MNKYLNICKHTDVCTFQQFNAKQKNEVINDHLQAI